MKRTLAAVALAGAASISFVVPVQAHHSVGSFYTDELIELEGEVVEFLYVNPHGQIVVQDAEGAYWVGETGSVLGLQRQGVTSDTLPVGTQVKLHALTSRDGTNRVHVEAIELDGEVVYGTTDS